MAPGFRENVPLSAGKSLLRRMNASGIMDFPAGLPVRSDDGRQACDGDTLKRLFSSIRPGRFRTLIPLGFRILPGIKEAGCSVIAGANLEVRPEECIFRQGSYHRYVIFVDKEMRDCDGTVGFPCHGSGTLMGNPSQNLVLFSKNAP